jgi:multiple sugar transport system permease protein
MSTKSKAYSVTKKQNLWGFLFVLPPIIFFLIFSLYPILDAMSISFFKYDLLTKKIFIGFGNYLYAFKDKLFINSVIVTIKFLCIGGTINLILSFFIALALRDTFRGKNFFRSIYFLPSILSLIASCIIWKVLLQLYGPINAILGLDIAWLTKKETALFGIMIMAIWRGIGYYMILFLAGLQAIPDEIYEAASIDGAGKLRILFKITLPLMKPVISFVIIILVVTGLKFFEPMYIMTQGGPNNATKVLTFTIYQNAFQFFKMGYAAAMSVLMFIAIVAITLIQLRIFKTEELS